MRTSVIIKSTLLRRLHTRAYYAADYAAELHFDGAAHFENSSAKNTSRLTLHDALYIILHRATAAAAAAAAAASQPNKLARGTLTPTCKLYCVHCSTKHQQQQQQHLLSS
jgi:hypothetical protein